MRGNPGGYLNSVEDILGEIMTNKKPMLQVEQMKWREKEILHRTEREKTISNFSVNR